MEVTVTGSSRRAREETRGDDSRAETRAARFAFAARLRLGVMCEQRTARIRLGIKAVTSSGRKSKRNKTSYQLFTCHL